MNRDTEQMRERTDLRRNLPRLLVYLRYLLPLFTGILLFVMGCCYSVAAAQGGVAYDISPVRLYFNTLSGARSYLASGENDIARNTLYGVLTAGAIVGMLVYLIALFLNALAAVTAVRAFRAGHESEQSNRMKMIFKVAFPNRVCLFIANALWLIPALFPLFFSKMGIRYLQVGLANTVFITCDLPLIVAGILTLLILTLAIFISRFERSKKMNMFLLWHTDEQ